MGIKIEGNQILKRHQLNSLLSIVLHSKMEPLCTNSSALGLFFQGLPREPLPQQLCVTLSYVQVGSGFLTVLFLKTVGKRARENQLNLAAEKWELLSFSFQKRTFCSPVLVSQFSIIKIIGKNAMLSKLSVPFSVYHIFLTIPSWLESSTDFFLEFSSANEPFLWL